MGLPLFLVCFLSLAVASGICVNRSPIRTNGIQVPKVPCLSSSSSSTIITTDDLQVKDSPRGSDGLLMKVLSISALVVQNSGLTITMRLSRVKQTATPLYLISTAVVTSELVKLLLSSIAYYCQERQSKNPGQMLETLFGNRREVAQTMIPSALYTLQNNLQFVATSNLPAEVYQVLVQLKLVTTAILSKTFLGKSLLTSQWLSIFGLFVGVAIVQLSLKTSATISHFNPLIGIGAVAISCFTSAFAGVYNEKLLRTGSLSLWGRNVQLTSVSVVFAMIACLRDLPTILRGGFYQGYMDNPLVFAVIGLQAIGGLIVSIVVKSSGSIVKGFATSGSIILSCLLSSMLLKDTTMNLKFLFGTLVVMLSTLMYSMIAVSRGVEVEANSKLLVTKSV
ncbi:nucleotide-sugar transporter-domain-containing protein [Ochromonadaceae sp. CCMP2298]|nr:nucleotide-sugar transporter-domain-containing protein [Ochromonadaceae sp. CCMP2298]